VSQAGTGRRVPKNEQPAVNRKILRA
jgi:hypothetical protein